MNARAQSARIDALMLEAGAALDVARRSARRAEHGVREAGRIVGVLHEDLVEPARVGEPVLVVPIAANRKLSPVDLIDVGGPRKRPVPRRPHVSATYLPVQQTCPRSCPFRGHGCMAQSGYTGRSVRRLEALAKGLDGWELARLEARAIDRLCVRGVPQDGGRDGTGSRDLRLHVSGDVTITAGARALAAAVRRWQRRGGGSAWTFTHAWKTIAREAWGPISVLASVEAPRDAELARARGYTPAITVRSFPSESRFRLRGSDTRWVPCPAETRERTCVECRLCLDRESHLFETGGGIAFAVHGPQGGAARRRLPVVREVAA